MPTPYMNMTLPVVGVTPGGGSGTSWGPELTASLNLVDAHDHSPGSGAPMKAQASTFKVVGDLDMGGRNLFDIGNVTMSTSASLTAFALTGSHTLLFPSGSTLPLAAFVGLGGIQVSTNSLGQVIVSGSFPEVSDITGSGGTSISSVGSIWTVSSSVGAGHDASFILTQPVAPGVAPNARTIVGQAGVTVTDGGPGGNLTVSGAIGTDKNASFVLLAPNAQAPNARTLSLSGSSLRFIDGGPGGSLTFQDAEVWNDTGNTAYTTASITVYGGLTGSLQQTTTPGNPFIIGVGGVQVTTNSLGQVIVSGSSGVISELVGLGGTVVSNVGSDYTVSSSIGADKFASYLLASASASDTNARLVTGSGGTSVIDGGPGGFLTLSSSIYADKFGAYVLLSASANDTNARTLTGSGGVSFTDAGAGGLLVLSASVGADRFASYLLTSASAVDPNARVITGSNGISVGDTGPGGTVTVAGLAAFVTALAATQTGVLTASVTAPAVSRKKTGIVEITGMIVVNPSTTTSGSAQLFRDTTPVGASMALPMGSQVPTAYNLQWVEALPDNSNHTYSIQVTSSVGTLSVIPNQGFCTVIEE